MEHNVGFLQQREADIKGRRQLAALDEIEANFENIRAAWHQAVKRRNHAAVNAMIEGLYWFCWMRGRYNEIDGLFGSAREAFAPQPGKAPHPVWARIVARSPGDDPKAEIEQSLAIAQTRNDRAEIAWCYRMLGRVVRQREGWAQSIPYFEQSLAIYRELGDDFYIARLVGALGGTYQLMGNLEKGIQLERESMELAEKIGDQVGAVSRVLGLGISAFMIGDYAEARRHWNIVAEQERPHMQAISSAFMGYLTLLNGDVSAARQMAQRALTTAREIGESDSENVALAVLGMCANLEEDYAAAVETLESIRFQRAAQVFSCWGFASAGCGRQDTVFARKYNRLGLEQAAHFNSPAWKLFYIPTSAAIATSQERAVELLGLAFTHPKTATGWIEKWPLITRLRDDLKAGLGETAYNAAWERGESLDLDAVVQELLVEFGDAP
ncbi:MAG: tetratricopeptide repeat protein [Anaerolineae bacterium]|nr:tetratricopeptide repeat protein [Anaerolineae bacterium]